MKFSERLKDPEHPSVAIIGLGYVGLPLALEFVRGGCMVTGIDVDPEKPRFISEGRSYLKHIPSERIAEAVGTGLLRTTTDFSMMKDSDAVIICVPTPLGKSREPDLSYVISTGRMVSRYLQPGQLVVLESTTYPGTTREQLVPILEESGLKAGVDFFTAFSPEREDPGNKHFSTRTIPKLVGALTAEGVEAAKKVYSCAVDNVVTVSSPEVAEMAKITENTYRAVNIALVNELKMLATRMGVDIWEVIGAASTKPFGYTPFYPGPGLGGHCIPIDPFYLTWKAHQFEMPTRFIELAGEINTAMPDFVVSVITRALNDRRKSVNGSRVIILGMAYKPDIDDIRETPALKVMDGLLELGAEVDYNDPYVGSIGQTRQTSRRPVSVDLTKEALAGYDCAVIITDHSCYDYQWIVDNSSLIVDTRNACSEVARGMEKVVKA
ncbi:MAG: nucleotide sugar dehydrogenase [Candidatus Fermentibacteraceae bacterium]|nr:nucleotide sugar dehydrogenase [Candidatus Fermentibacteraceae bacterium]MBN2609728.1 nucleotide sugar dehydrogenase [Candidatus Fermentibacteraceae bacterium]